MKKVILLGVIIFYLSGIPVLAQEKVKGTMLIKGKKAMKNSRRLAEARSYQVSQEKNFIEEGYDNFWEIYEKITNLEIGNFFDSLNLPTPIYFRAKRDIKLSYRKDKILNLSGKDFIFGLSWTADNNTAKKNNKKNLKFGLEIGVNRNHGNERMIEKNLSFLGGFRIKF